MVYITAILNSLSLLNKLPHVSNIHAFVGLIIISLLSMIILLLRIRNRAKYKTRPVPYSRYTLPDDPYIKSITSSQSRRKLKLKSSNFSTHKSLFQTSNNSWPKPDLSTPDSTFKESQIKQKDNLKSKKILNPSLSAETKSVSKNKNLPNLKSVKEVKSQKSNPKAIIVNTAPEEYINKKYIGYNPINIFAQTEPLTYPYVIMPKPNCVIKFPRKGRVGRKGYKEEDFKIYILRYFAAHFQVFDDRFILVKNNDKPFEPDFTLVDEKDNINIFIDIEIDEPYEGSNDVFNRKVTHYQYADVNRNNAFKNRGWIIIRLAEIQVHQNPSGCCLFVADVIKSINPKFNIPPSLANSKQVQVIRQWTKEEAEKWSLEKYRERYLGITNFGLTTENSFLEGLTETDLGNKIEQEVIEEPKFIPPVIQKIASNPKLDLIKSAINSNIFLSFNYQGSPTITKPIRIINNELIAFCYILNRERAFDLYEISNLVKKDNYYTLRVAGPTIGLDKITNAVNTAINYNKHIRMKYTRGSWANMFVDPDTGELIQNNIEAEESIRTINNVQLSLNALTAEEIAAYNLNSNHITAYCNKRNENRTFRFDRIGEIEILDI